jgi:hypothetical protein
MVTTTVALGLAMHTLNAAMTLSGKLYLFSRRNLHHHRSARWSSLCMANALNDGWEVQLPRRQTTSSWRIKGCTNVRTLGVHSTSAWRQTWTSCQAKSMIPRIWSHQLRSGHQATLRWEASIDHWSKAKPDFHYFCHLGGRIFAFLHCIFANFFKIWNACPASVPIAMSDVRLVPYSHLILHGVQLVHGVQLDYCDWRVYMRLTAWIVFI